MNRLVVVSNRVPLPSAGPQAGGLAVALDGVIGCRTGIWFGWSGKISADAATKPLSIENSPDIEYATFDLTQREHDGYYNRFSNGVLWPLLHSMPDLVTYHRRDAKIYRSVNYRIAQILQQKLRPSDLIWIHDYHLLPLAAALRARQAHNPIGFFLHIPFAPVDVLTVVPDMTALVRDMLAADLIGFQTDNDLRNFVAAAQALTDARRLPDQTLQVGLRRVRLGVFPVEIDANAFAKVAAEMAASTESDRLRRSMTGQAMILGIDRLDPTKGLVQRISGLRTLFDRYPDWRRQTSMVQIAATSRGDVSSYRTLRAKLDQESGALNADFGDADWVPLRFVTRGVPREVAAGYMRLARVGFVTPVRDGMNLVAKEFVASQDPQDPGVLVLSRFAGAARQLEAALLVNPHDHDDLADALHTALRMSLTERQERWRALWNVIEGRSPLTWGREFVMALTKAAADITDAPTPPSRHGVPLYGTGEPCPPERLPLLERPGADRDALRSVSRRSKPTDGHRVN